MGIEPGHRLESPSDHPHFSKACHQGNHEVISQKGADTGIYVSGPHCGGQPYQRPQTVRPSYAVPNGDDGGLRPMSGFQSTINVKVLGIHWREGRLLAAEVRDSRGQVVGVRPLGGTVEFGESSEAAVRREFLEELGFDIGILSGPTVLENIYVFEGESGHEVFFIFVVDFAPDKLSPGDTIVYHESDGTSGIARWYDLDDLDRPAHPSLFPQGLRALLTA